MKLTEDIVATANDSERMLVEGGRSLQGHVEIDGAKNAVLKQMAACLLVPAPVQLRNVPVLSDVYTMMAILRELGGECIFDSASGVLDIDCSQVRTHFAPHELVRKLRASFVILGPLLGRCGKARVSLPGGCKIGARRIDLHEKGLRKLGAEIDLENGQISALGPLQANSIELDVPSNGATENLMMASVTAPGVTTINNAAKDPEIEDLANFLNACGADISGAGSQWIEIRGVPLERMHGTSYRVVPDRIEAGTFLIAGVATRGKVRTNNVVPKHLSSLSAKLLEMGAGVETGDDWIEVSYRGELRATDISTVWYPGFPTDLQPQFSSLATLAHGVSVIKENIYEDRFAHIQELTGMGANARQPSHDLAIIEGVETLTGSQVSGNDLRATAGLIIAGMMAQGGSEVYGLSHLDRGYADFAGKLRSLGANVTRCP